MSSFITSSEAAIEIEEMSADGYGYSGVIDLSVSVETNEPYDEVNYYLDGEWIGASSGNNVKTTASYYGYGIDVEGGSVSGTIYEIKAEVWRQDAEENFSQDTEYYYLTIYEPIVTTDADGKVEPDIPFVSGYAEISKQTYDPVSGVMSFDYYVSAYHLGGDDEADLETEHKVSFPDLGIEVRKPPITGTIEDEIGKRSFYDPDGSHSATIEGGFAGREYTGEAYIRLIVTSGGDRDDYHLTNTMDCEHP